MIKIERADGDFARNYDSVVQGLSSYFVRLNRGKQSLVLDIKSEPDATLLKRMLARPDVFIENLAHGVVPRTGFRCEELRRLNPRLITGDSSGYGESAPYAGMKAYDLPIQAESGVASVTGHPAGPGQIGVSVSDIACGMSAHAAVLKALIERDITGRSKELLVSSTIWRPLHSIRRCAGYRLQLWEDRSQSWPRSSSPKMGRSTRCYAVIGEHSEAIRKKFAE